MDKLALLRGEFAKPGISIEDRCGDLTSVVLEHDGAIVRVCLHGAHVLGYQPRDQAPVLWLSPEAVFAPATPIRGGIPICWPWFADHAHDPGLPAHGFARITEWKLANTESDAEEKVVTLTLRDDANTYSLWPHAFELHYRVSLAQGLTTALTVSNTGKENMHFTAALHSYFDVSDIGQVSLEGLAACEFLDKVEAYRRKRQEETLLRFSGETDRIYCDTASECVIDDAGRERRIAIAKTGSRTTVVWNPWSMRARQMADFPDDGYRRMLCVETANAADDGIELAPGANHTLSVSINDCPHHDPRHAGK